MKNLFLTKTRWLVTIILLTALGSGNVWGAEGDVLQTYNTNSSTFSTGYKRQSGDNFVWWGQKNYFGANSNDNHKKLLPTAADLPVVKAQDASAKTSTTGLYYCYTSEAVANVGALEITFSAKSGSSTVNAYIVTSSTKAADGSATWTKVTLSKSSTKAQDENVASAGTYRFTFNATETGAKYYGVVFATSSAWRATGFQMKLIEGATSSKTLSSIDITTQPTTTKYIVGETFSKTGAVVTATYSDATTADVSSSATWTPTTGLTSGSNTITASYTEGGVTKTATTTVTAYTVTVQKKDEDGTTIADAGVTASATGRTLTASTGSTKYAFKQWKFGTASGTSIASATSASTSLTGTPSAAVTVIAEFYKPVTVTWVVNGSEYTTTQVANGSKPEIPSNPSSCDGTSTTFVGWTPTPWSGKLDDVSDKTIYTSGSEMPNVSGPVTYHAVFAKETSTLTPVPDTWTRITSTSQLTDGATVMLVQYYSDFAINNTPGATKCTANAEITNNSTDLRWIAVKSGSKWKFKTSGGAYLSTNALANNTNLGLNQTYDEWTISADDGGTTGSNNIYTNTNCFRLNNGSDLEYYSGVFKLYTWSLKYSSAYPFYIYIQKTTGSTTYSQYLTTCCTNNVPAPTVIATNTAYTVTLTWGAVDGATGYEVSWNGGAFEAATSPCVKSGLTASTDYIYKVRATYDPLVKCGALVASGNVTTDDVYSVTYSGGTGTGSCSPSGSVAPVSYEVGATVTLAPTNSFSMTSNTFAAWVVKDADDNVIPVSNNQFTMPAKNVTVTATWTAVQDKYYDRMHDGTDALHGGIADGEGKYYLVLEGCNYTVPALTDDAEGDTDCHTTHFKLLGWIAQSRLKADGQIKPGEERFIFQGGGTKSATGATYYAIWAIMTE